MSEDIVRFYVAELSTAIAFLHEKKIIHRSVPVPLVLKLIIRLIYINRQRPETGQYPA